MSEEIRESTLILIGRVVYYFSHLEETLFEFTTALTVSPFVEAILARENVSKLQEQFVTVLREKVTMAEIPNEPLPEQLSLLEEARELTKKIDDVKGRRNRLLHGRLDAYYVFDRPTLSIIRDPAIARGLRRIRAVSKAGVTSKGYDVTSTAQCENALHSLLHMNGARRHASCSNGGHGAVLCARPHGRRLKAQ